MTDRRLVLFSKSSLKFKAVSEANVFATLTAVDEGDTECPQPIGLKSAFECAQRRIFRSKTTLRDDDIALSVENFIDLGDKTMCDRALVLLVGKNLFLHTVSSGRHAVPIEAKFAALLPKADIAEPMGCRQTFGEAIRLAHDSDDSAPPSNDWYQYVNAKNPSRHEQIKETCAMLFKLFQTAQSVPKQMSIYRNFPTKNVSFADIFSLSAQSMSLLVNVFCNTVLSIVAGRDTNNVCIVGLESRGLAFGMVVANTLGLTFVPARKANKLPRDEARKILTVTYVTEYSSDTLEIQPAHLPANADCILIDDFVATGGSLAAVESLLHRAGGRVLGCVVASSIPDTVISADIYAKVYHCW